MRLAAVIGVLLLAGCSARPMEGPGEPSSSGDAGVGSTDPASETSSGSGTTASPHPGRDSAVLVTVQRTVWVNRTSGDQRPFGDFGHHCGEGRWTESPPAVVFYDWSYQSSGSVSSGPGDPWPASGMLAATYEAPQEEAFQRVGSAPTIRPFDAANGTVGLPAAFQPRGPVAVLTATAGAYDIDGAPLVEGAPVTVDEAYSFAQGDSTYDVHERLRFSLHGIAEVTVEAKGQPCI